MINILIYLYYYKKYYIFINQLNKSYSYSAV